MIFTFKIVLKKWSTVWIHYKTSLLAKNFCLLLNRWFLSAFGRFDFILRLCLVRFNSFVKRKIFIFSFLLFLLHEAILQLLHRKFLPPLSHFHFLVFLRCALSLSRCVFLFRVLFLSVLPLLFLHQFLQYPPPLLRCVLLLRALLLRLEAQYLLRDLK